jgi:hypothetical protein
MKLTKTIKIKQKDKTIELMIKQDGNAKWDSEKFKKDFEYLIDSIMITLLEHECHYSEVESK